MYPTRTLSVIPALVFIALACAACASAPAPAPAAHAWGLQSAKAPTLAQLRGEPARRSSDTARPAAPRATLDPSLAPALAPAPDATAAHVAGSPLSHDQLEAGFAHIRRSVDQCLARTLKRDGQVPADAVELRVVIAKTGAVARLQVNRDLHQSPFAACLNAHRDRWRFPRFSGAPVRVAKTFRLQ